MRLGSMRRKRYVWATRTHVDVVGLAQVEHDAQDVAAAESWLSTTILAVKRATG